MSDYTTSEMSYIKIVQTVDKQAKEVQINTKLRKKVFFKIENWSLYVLIDINSLMPNKTFIIVQINMNL